MFLLLSKKQKRFADGETAIQVNENVREKTIFLIQPTKTNDNLMELLLLSSTMKRASAEQIIAIVPYFGYSRSVCFSFCVSLSFFSNMWLKIDPISSS